MGCSAMQYQSLCRAVGTQVIAIHPNMSATWQRRSNHIQPLKPPLNNGGGGGGGGAGRGPLCKCGRALG